jgi:lysine biosynthesis protein LysW
MEQAAACGACGADLHVEGRLLIGEVVDCDGCSAPLEVVALEPLRVAPFARIEEEPEDFQGFEPL